MELCNPTSFIYIVSITHTIFQSYNILSLFSSYSTTFYSSLYYVSRQVNTQSDWYYYVCIFWWFFPRCNEHIIIKYNKDVHSHHIRGKHLLRIPKGTVRFSNLSARIWNGIVNTVNVNVPLYIMYMHVCRCICVFMYIMCMYIKYKCCSYTQYIACVFYYHSPVTILYISWTASLERSFDFSCNFYPIIICSALNEFLMCKVEIHCTLNLYMLL